MRYSSGETAKATSGDASIALFDSAGQLVREVNIINTSQVRGWVCCQGDAGPWLFLPAATSEAPGVRTILFEGAGESVDVRVKRVAGGTDLTGLFGDAS